MNPTLPQTFQGGQVMPAYNPSTGTYGTIPPVTPTGGNMVAPSGGIATSAPGTYQGGQPLPAFGGESLAHLNTQNPPPSPTTAPNAYPTTSPTTTIPPQGTANQKFLEDQRQNQSSIDSLNQKLFDQKMAFVNGSVPLNQYEQAQIDATENSYKAVIDAQKLANQNYEGGVTVQNENMGLSRYSPIMAAGNLLSAQTEGLKRVTDLNTKMQLSVSTMKQGFQESNYKMVKDAYDDLISAQKDKTAEIEKVYAVAQKQEETVKQGIQDQVLTGVNSIMYDSSLTMDDRKKKIAQLISQGQLTGAQIKGVQNDLRTMEQDDIKNKLDSDKFSWQQKVDIADNAVKQGQLSVDQARLALDKAKVTADNPVTGTAAIKAKDDITNNLNLVTSILDDPYLDNAVGIKTPGAMTLPFMGGKTLGTLYGSNVEPVVNKLNQLTSVLSLENRQKLKGSGAISDFESKTLEKSASAFSTGLSNQAARKELHQIQGVMRTANGLETPVKIKDTKTGEYNILNLGRDGINEAVRQGFLVEYQ